MLMLKDLMGESNLNHLVLATNRWPSVPNDNEEDREADLVADHRCFGSSQGRVQVRRLNSTYTREDGMQILEPFRTLLPVTLQIQREAVDESKNYDETSAGIRISGHIAARAKELEDATEAAIKEVSTLVSSCRYL
jgi:hypothetical protein